MAAVLSICMSDSRLRAEAKGVACAEAGFAFSFKMADAAMREVVVGVFTQGDSVGVQVLSAA